MVKTLVIGAGERRVAGAIHHDVQKLPGIDIVCEFYDLPGYVKPETCDEIHMTHVLEHFPFDETGVVLKVINQLLVLGGKIYIEVPNFHWHAQEIIKNPMNRKVVEYAFGGQLNKWDFHYNGFTPEILVDDMLEAGFRLDDMKPNSSIEAWFTKISQS